MGLVGLVGMWQCSQPRVCRPASWNAARRGLVTSRCGRRAVLLRQNHPPSRMPAPQISSGGGARTAVIVATSAHWYDDEEEYDPLTDSLKAKLVVLVSSSGCAAGTPADAASIAALRAYLHPLVFNQAFASQEVCRARSCRGGGGGGNSVELVAGTVVIAETPVVPATVCRPWRQRRPSGRGGTKRLISKK